MLCFSQRQFVKWYQWANRNRWMPNVAYIIHAPHRTFFCQLCECDFMLRFVYCFCTHLIFRVLSSHTCTYTHTPWGLFASISQFSTLCQYTINYDNLRIYYTWFVFTIFFLFWRSLLAVSSVECMRLSFYRILQCHHVQWNSQRNVWARNGGWGEDWG